MKTPDMAVRLGALRMKNPVMVASGTFGYGPEYADIDLPIIDWRNYLEDELNMHNAQQSFASRKRMLNVDGDASNQVVWFTDVV